ncbi:MAG: DUF368 domain-containing protein [Candidatus Phytoplasma sp.]|nr:DUF368 domain-containing protein [Phytoplasma sp.]
MSRFIKIIRSVLIGIGAILPGVSGGMIAASFNIYKPLIEALNQVTRHPIKAFLSIWEYLLGIFIGLIIAFLGVMKIFEYIPIPSTLLFIGLILGGIPEILFYAKYKEMKLKNILVTVSGFIIMISVIFLEQLGGLTTTSTNYFMWFIVGFLITTSFIIPGLSGTMILLMIGYYKPMLALVNDLIKSLIVFDFSVLYNEFWSIVFIALGLIISAIILAKLISVLLKKIPEYFYQFILGIIIASPINIVYSLNIEMSENNIFNFKETWLSWLIGCALIPLGIWIARLFTKGEKNETKTN